MDLLTELAILVLAAFVGFEVISKVPNTLHTPLMSATNAIHGIVVLGGLLLIGPATAFLNKLLLVIAIAFGTINVVGGFLVTDRMLGMFKGKQARARAEASADGRAMSPAGRRTSSGPLHRRLLAVHRRAADAERPAHGGARQPHRRRRHGDRRRRDAADRGGRRLGLIVARRRDRHRGRRPRARSVKMTAMPQMVALFNGVGGGAVALIAFVEYRAAGGDRRRLRSLIPILFAAIIGSISLLGLEHRVRQAPGDRCKRGRSRTPTAVNAVLLADRRGAGRGHRRRLESEALFMADPGRRRRARRAGRAADRRRRHAGRDLAR